MNKQAAIDYRFNPNLPRLEIRHHYNEARDYLGYKYCIITLADGRSADFSIQGSVDQIIEDVKDFYYFTELLVLHDYEWHIR